MLWTRRRIVAPVDHDWPSSPSAHPGIGRFADARRAAARSAARWHEQLGNHTAMMHVRPGSWPWSTGAKRATWTPWKPSPGGTCSFAWMPDCNGRPGAGAGWRWRRSTGATGRRRCVHAERAAELSPPGVINGARMGIAASSTAPTGGAKIEALDDAGLLAGQNCLASVEPNGWGPWDDADGGRSRRCCWSSATGTGRRRSTRSSAGASSGPATCF